jgi:hypothetical protein
LKCGILIILKTGYILSVDFHGLVHALWGLNHYLHLAVITAFDHAIGNVLDALDSLGINDNTFVFLFSDNGAFRLGREVDIGINDPLRDGGVTCWGIGQN